MDPIKLEKSDLRQHVVQIGLDVFPQIEIANERTRLNLFAEEAINKLPHLCEQLVSGPREFRVCRSLAKAPGRASTSVDTVTLTARGPIFTFPVELMTPTGVNLFTMEPGSYRNDFDGLRDLFLGCVPGHQIMRLGLVRQLLFLTGTTSCLGALTSRSVLAGAQLAEGGISLLFRDERCNVALNVKPMQLMEAASMPIGPTFQRSLGYGVQVILDVNNREVRPQTSGDMMTTLDRADGLWPEVLLEYLGGGQES